MGAKKQTLGYHYLMTMVFGLGRGGLNEIREITVGGETAWSGHLCGPDAQKINSPDLFGGEKKEGGIQGAFRLNNGDLDQVLPGSEVVTGIGSKGPAMTATLMNLRDIVAGKVSQLRGIAVIHFDGLVSSMNPYPKEWAFRARRTTLGWATPVWYPAKATIWLSGTQPINQLAAIQYDAVYSGFLDDFYEAGGTGTNTINMTVPGSIWAMNGAHIIYQALTDPDWGNGDDEAEIDANSFVGVANTLCEEGLGLCMKWERKDDVDVFVKSVLDHIGGALYTDRETGLYTLKLMRADYVVADLPLFTPDSGLLEITEDDSEALDGAINEVIVTGTNPNDKGNDIQVRVQNIASIQATGARVTNSIAYPGLPNADLCTRVAQRDLKAAASGLKKFNIRLDRRAWRMYPSMPFRIADPKRGIGEIVVRAGEISDDDDMGDGSIKVKVIEDVFGMPSTSFVVAPDPVWEGPIKVALPPAAQRLIEAGYRDIYVGQGQAQAEAMTNTDAAIGVLAAAPNTSTNDYDLYTRVPPDAYELNAAGFFTDFALLALALDYYDVTMSTTGATLSFDPETLIGQAVMIDNEVIGITAWDSGTAIFDILRGTADTLPATHALGARLWTIDDDLISDQEIYQLGEEVDAKVLTRISTDSMTLDEATELSLTMVARQARPYPPANLMLDGELVYNMSGGIHVEPILTWAHRDRVLEDDELVGHEEGSIGPEPGTTYTIRIYDAVTDALLGTHDAGALDTWTYDATMQGADGSPSQVRMEVESVRETLASWQLYSFNVTLSGGYGMGYGFNYGGGS